MLTETQTKVQAQYELHRELSRVEPSIESNVLGFLQTRRNQILQEARRTRRGIFQIAAGFFCVAALGLSLKSKPMVIAGVGTTAAVGLVAVAQSNPRIVGKRAILDFSPLHKQREYSALADSYDDLAVKLTKIKPSERIGVYINLLDDSTAVDPQNEKCLYLDVDLRHQVLKLVKSQDGTTFEGVRVSRRWTSGRPPKHILRQILNELVGDGKISLRDNKYYAK